jgi:deoxycytidylate deaminase
MEPGRWPQWRPLKRHDSHVAEQMVERAAELARDSHARTRHAAVLIKDDSMMGWGTNGVPFPGEDHCYCKFGEFGHHDMCRTHAEQRAITLACEGDGWRMLPGSKLIYVRLEADDSVRLEKPHFCPRCSRLALSLGVAEWIFALSEGLVGYSCADYDTISQLGWLPTPPGPPSTRHTGPTMTIKPDVLTTTRAIAAVRRGRLAREGGTGVGADPSDLRAPTVTAARCSVVPLHGRRWFGLRRVERGNARAKIVITVA